MEPVVKREKKTTERHSDIISKTLYFMQSRKTHITVCLPPLFLLLALLLISSLPLLALLPFLASGLKVIFVFILKKKYF